MTNKPRLGLPSRTNAEGEGVLSSFLSKYATLHKVHTSDDIGIDYFGEWLNKITDKSLESTNVLFAIQLKTSDKNNVVTTFIEKDKQYNQLARYELKRKDGKRYDDIKKTIIEYWKGFEIPVYLFVVLLSDSNHEVYYKRFTPILHNTVQRGEEKFYKVSKKTKFHAFATENNTGGFCRDLFIDYIRCNYKKGSIAYKNPRTIGLSQFPEDPETVFDMVKKEYKKEIANTYNKLNEIGLFSEIDHSSSCSPSVSENNSNLEPSKAGTSLTFTGAGSAPPEEEDLK